MGRRILLVDDDGATRWGLVALLEEAGYTVIAASTLHAAKQALIAEEPDLLITDIRLGAYNGLHLVLLATSEGVTRSLVHTDRPDPYLVREAQSIGAFFERTERLLHAVVGYIHYDLPQRDRRNSDRYDRRTAFRGGRRAADIALPA